jgi:ATP-dependent DNA ligase
MLARSGRGMPVDLKEWAIEPKWDGWRCLARIGGGTLRLTSRRRNDITGLFPELGELPVELAHRRVLLDGEIVALRADRSQGFRALTSRRRGTSTRLALMCFDVLHVDGRDVIRDPYEGRRQALEQLGLQHGHGLTTPSLQHEAGAALYAFTLAQGWEGVVAKRLDATYQPSARNGAWLKAKHPHARDLNVDRSTWTQRDASPSTSR